MTTLYAAAVLVAAATPVPAEKNSPGGGPGFFGFVLLVALGVASILLLIDMVRRVRRVHYRTEINERLDAEEEAAGRAQREQDDDEAR